MKKQFLLLLGLLWSLAGLVACKNDTTGPAGGAFDRTAMLNYYADQHIIPAYDNLATAAERLLTASNQLINQANSQNLADSRTAWLQLYLAWQQASLYTFGPAGEQGLKRRLSEETATFPVSESKINQFIANNDTSFANFDRDSRGIFALEYFLWSGTETDIISRIQDPAAARYMMAVARKLEADYKQVKTAWQSYRTEFIQANGTSAGSSTTQLYNEFLLTFEGLKNFKLGLPLGLRVGQNQPEPQKVEAWYSGQSLQGIAHQWSAIKSFWAADKSPNGQGFKQYLLTVPGGDALVAQTEYQMQVIDQKLAACGQGRLDSLIINQPQPATELHTELQRHTRFFKSDLSSLLGLTITYSSGDGD
jgi:predicted lipoprotein